MGIWDENQQLIISGVVGAGETGQLIGEHRYLSTQPTLLAVGHSYVIGAAVDSLPKVVFYDDS